MFPHHGEPYQSLSIFFSQLWIHFVLPVLSIILPTQGVKMPFPCMHSAIHLAEMCSSRMQMKLFDHKQAGVWIESANVFSTLTLSLLLTHLGSLNSICMAFQGPSPTSLSHPPQPPSPLVKEHCRDIYPKRTSIYPCRYFKLNNDTPGLILFRGHRWNIIRISLTLHWHF